MLADERKLKQIVYNLLSNAVKFTPDGGAVTLARAAARVRRWLSTMRCRGGSSRSAPSEDNEFPSQSPSRTPAWALQRSTCRKLFEPFTQVDNSLARRQEGTGLGLSLVRRLAELHGGTVGVASRPGSAAASACGCPGARPDTTSRRGQRRP
jgi:signal transduction histidine kinase